MSASDSSIRRLMSVGSILGVRIEAEHLPQNARDAVGLFGRDLQELGVRVVSARSCW